MEKINWSSELSLGIEVIDNQHHHFVDLINELNDAIQQKKETSVLGYYLATLLQYADEHFATEEKYFQEFNYVDSDQHVKAHRDLTDRLNKIMIRFEKEGPVVTAGLVDFLIDWLENHLAIEDKKYVQCFKEHGLK